MIQQIPVTTDRYWYPQLWRRRFIDCYGKIWWVTSRGKHFPYNWEAGLELQCLKLPSRYICFFITNNVFTNRLQLSSSIFATHFIDYSANIWYDNRFSMRLCVSCLRNWIFRKQLMMISANSFTGIRQQRMHISRSTFSHKSRRSLMPPGSLWQGAKKSQKHGVDPDRGIQWLTFCLPLHFVISFRSFRILCDRRGCSRSYGGLDEGNPLQRMTVYSGRKFWDRYGQMIWQLCWQHPILRFWCSELGKWLEFWLTLCWYMGCNPIWSHRNLKFLSIYVVRVVSIAAAKSMRMTTSCIQRRSTCLNHYALLARTST